VPVLSPLSEALFIKIKTKSFVKIEVWRPFLQAWLVIGYSSAHIRDPERGPPVAWKKQASLERHGRRHLGIQAFFVRVWWTTIERLPASTLPDGRGAGSLQVAGLVRARSDPT